jgi:Cof subfamily protein (haloacid dehalogenase superfamily)
MRTRADRTEKKEETKMRSSERIRLLIADVDGTMLNPAGELSAVTYVTVGRLRQAGVKLSLSSARPSFGMQWLIRMLEIDCACSGLNGGILFHPHGGVVVERELESGVVEEITERMRNHELDVWLFTREQWFIPRSGRSHARHQADALRTEPQRYVDLREIASPILKIVGTSDRHAEVAACEAELQKELAGQVSAARSQPQYLDITYPSANKGEAATAIALAEGIPLQEVATVGDSPVDIPMFEASGLSIAMGQASEEVRNAADEVTRSNADNGLAWAIEYVLSGKWGAQRAASAGRS